MAKCFELNLLVFKINNSEMESSKIPDSRILQEMLISRNRKKNFPVIMDFPEKWIHILLKSLMIHTELPSQNFH